MDIGCLKPSGNSIDLGFVTCEPNFSWRCADLGRENYGYWISISRNHFTGRYTYGDVVQSRMRLQKWGTNQSKQLPKEIKTTVWKAFRVRQRLTYQQTSTVWTEFQYGARFPGRGLQFVSFFRTIGPIKLEGILKERTPELSDTLPHPT